MTSSEPAPFLSDALALSRGALYWYLRDTPAQGRGIQRWTKKISNYGVLAPTKAATRNPMSL
jgi:hypothetical protein